MSAELQDIHAQLKNSQMRNSTNTANSFHSETQKLHVSGQYNPSQLANPNARPIPLTGIEPDVATVNNGGTMESSHF